jgi:endoglucanase
MKGLNITKRLTSLMLAFLLALSLNPLTISGFLPSPVLLEYLHTDEIVLEDETDIYVLDLDFDDFGAASTQNVCAFCVIENMGPGWNLGNTFDATHIGHGSNCGKSSPCIPNAANPPLTFNGVAGTGIWACGFGSGTSTRRYSTDSITALETAWLGNETASQTTQALINNVRAAGFTTIRIPVTWYKATSGPPNWTINTTWMNRVQEVVDMAYNQNMTVILNTHHEELIFNEWLGVARRTDSLNYIDRIWTQIATRFNNNYGPRLIFEGLNEPRVRSHTNEWNGGTADHRTTINQLNQRFVTSVRERGGNNAHRILMVPTYAASVHSNAFLGFTRPSDPIGNPTGNTPRIALSVHAYVPNAFAGVGTGALAQTWALTDITSMMNDVMARTNASNLNMPVVFGEWGAVSRASTTNENQRISYATAYAREAASRRAGHVWWDNGLTDPARHDQRPNPADEREGNFGLFNRRGQWTGTPAVPRHGLVFPNVSSAISTGHTTGVGQRTGQSRCNCFQITSAASHAVQVGVGGTFQVQASSSGVTFGIGTPSAPSGISINSSTGVLTIASSVPLGTYVFQLTAANAQRTVVQSFALTVSQSGAAPGRNYRNLTLTPGQNDTIMRFNWHSGSPTGSIKIWEQGNPASLRTIASARTDEFVVDRVGSEGGIAAYNVHQATVNNLERNTAYQYTVVWNTGESSPKTFRTGGAANFQFLLMSDIQIGTGGIENDTTDWTGVMRIASRAFPSAQFTLALGDNTASATLTGNAQNPTPLELRNAQRRFDGLFAPSQMQSLPFMPAIGNHDGLAVTGSANNMMPYLWNRHFNFNALGTGTAASVNPRRHSGTLPTQFDYWFRYGEVLFVQLDSNTRTMDTNRQAWLNNVINANLDARWRVAFFHHAPYSVNRETNHSEKTAIISAWIPRLEAHDFDIVLAGHDHVYSRTHHMRRGSGSSVTPRLSQRFVNAQGQVEQGEFGATNYAVLNPEGITYLALGTPTRSNARIATGMPRSYILRHNSAHVSDANQGAANTRRFSTVNVTPTTFSVATYEVNNVAAGQLNSYRMVDVYTIVKNPGGGVPSGTVIPQFDNAWKVEPDPFTDVTHNWNINRAAPGDRNVTHGASAHVRVLSGVQVTPSMIESGEAFELTVNYNENAGGSRRILAWTNLSGSGPNINDIAFLTTDNIRNGHVAVSPALTAASTSATITIPRSLISSGTNTATTIYVAIALNAGDDGHSSPGDGQDPVPDRYIAAGNHRGGGSQNEFLRVNSVRLNAKADLDIGAPPLPCADCNNLPCRCVPSFRVEFRPNGGTRTGGGALIQEVYIGSGAVPPTLTRAGHIFTWDTLIHNVQSDLIVTAQWVQVQSSGNPNVIYDMQTTTRVGAVNGFSDFSGSGGMSGANQAAFAPLGRRGDGTTVYTTTTGPPRAVSVVGRNGVSQSINLALFGTNGLGSTGMPLVAGRNYRIEYTAMFPTGGTPRIRFEGASAHVAQIPGGVVDTTHVRVDGSPVAAGVVFTHSVTLTQAQLNTIGARDVSLSSTSGNNDIVYANIRIIEHTAPPTTHTVTFAQPELTATVGGSVVTNPAQVTQGGSIIFTATPPAGHVVGSWTVNGTVVSGQTGLTLSRVINAPSTVTVQFHRLGAITTGGTGNITSLDLTHLARVVAGHSGFTLTDNRLGNLRGLTRPPRLSDVTLMARLLIGYDFEILRSETEN